MAEEKTPQEAPVPEPHQAPGHDHEFETLKGLLGRYGTPILAGIVIAVLIILGFGTYRSLKVSSADQASMALSDAETIEDYQRILGDFGATPSAPIAQLGLAAKYFAAEDYAEAEKAYAGFIADHPEHPMVGAARVARIQCLEAEGEVEKALEGFTGLLASEPDSYLAPYVAFGKARCLAQLQRLEDARAAYEDVIAGHPDSVWARRAQSDVQWVERLLRAQSSP